MAPETKAQKRKSVSQPAAVSKKLKQSAPVETAKSQKKVESPKTAKPKAAEPVRKSPRTKAPGPVVAAKDEVAVKANGAAKKSALKKAKEPEPEPEVNEEELGSDSDSELDDQTAALLKGFESSDEEDEAEAVQDDAGIAIASLPEIPSDKKTKQALAKAEKEQADAEPGVIYVGRIPHGFYEHQMRAYFSQFGDILRLRLSRNKKTGQSKHYAFVEFASSSVAKIVAGTMDKYLLFGHILQVRIIPKEQVHEDLFKDANRRFKVVPRNKIEGTALKKGTSREGWEKRVGAEQKRRKDLEKKLKGIGYSFKAPAVKQVKDVPIREAEVKTAAQPETNSPVAEKDAEKAAPKLLAEKPHEEVILEDLVTVEAEQPNVVKVTETVTAKKGKGKGKGAAAVPVEATPVTKKRATRSSRA